MNYFPRFDFRSMSPGKFTRSDCKRANHAIALCGERQICAMSVWSN